MRKNTYLVISKDDNRPHEWYTDCKETSLFFVALIISVYKCFKHDSVEIKNNKWHWIIKGSAYNE